MAELDVIIKTLQRQRKDSDELLEKTSSRSTETGALLEKINELRARAERTSIDRPARSAPPDPKQSR